MTDINGEKYSVFLKIIVGISLWTLIIEIVVFLVNVINQKLIFLESLIFSGISIILLIFIISMGYAITSENLFLLDAIIDEKKISKMFNKNRGRFITALFFLFVASNILFIIQDGGSKNSSISNILLLNATLGCTFAEKSYIKKAIIAVCLLCYFIGFIFYFDISQNRYIFMQINLKSIFPFFIASIITIIVNLYIEKYIKGNIYKKQFLANNKNDNSIKM